MGIKRSNIIAALIASALISFALVGNTNKARAYANRDGRFQIGTGLGFTVDPTTFALGAEGAYYFTPNISINPRIAFGFGDDFLFMIMADGRYTFDISHAKLLDLKPFAGFGLGVVIGDPEGPDDTDVAFAFEIPVGFDYYLSNYNPNISLGTEMQFMIPIDLFDDNFMFQWLLVTFKYLF